MTLHQVDNGPEPELAARCCYLEGGRIDGKRCERLAEFEIWDHEELNTHACRQHLEELKSAECTVHRFRVPGDCDTISETPIGETDATATNT